MQKAMPKEITKEAWEEIYNSCGIGLLRFKDKRFSKTEFNLICELKKNKIPENSKSNDVKINRVLFKIGGRYFSDIKFYEFTNKFNMFFSTEEIAIMRKRVFFVGCSDTSRSSYSSSVYDFMADKRVFYIIKSDMTEKGSAFFEKVKKKRKVN